MEDTTQRAINAVIEYISRKNKLSFPKGFYDTKQRWYPDDSEKRPCCKQIRAPSYKYPWSSSNHCRSLKHVCNLFQVTTKDIDDVLPLLISHPNIHVQEYLEQKLKRRS